MKRELPEMVLEKDRFVVDVSMSELRLKEDPLSTISFFDMKEITYGYRFDYNERTKSLATSYSDPKDVFQYSIPHMVQLDPGGVAEKYGIAVSELPRSDRALQQDPALWQERIDGILPKISISGEEYMVDIQSKTLLSLSRDYVIPLSELTMTEKGDKYIGFYDMDKKAVLSLQTKIEDLPKHAQLLIVPGEVWIDPLGAVEKHQLFKEAFMKKHPVQNKQEGRLYDLKDTAILKAQKNDQKLLGGIQDRRHKHKRKKGKSI